MYTAPNRQAADTRAPADTPVGWRLVAALRVALESATGVAYNARVIAHLLATSDHRHLAEWAGDLDGASEAWTAAQAGLATVCAEAATTWGASPLADMAALLDIAPADVTEELAQELIERRKRGPKDLGMHPDEGLPIYVKDGPFGEYLQMGDDVPKDAPDDTPKPKRCSIPKHVDSETITLDTAIAYLALPRQLGKHPDTGNVVNAGIGKFGPYVTSRKDGRQVFKSLGKDHDVLTVDLDKAVQLLAEVKPRGPAPPLKELGKHPEDGESEGEDAIRRVDVVGLADLLESDRGHRDDGLVQRVEERQAEEPVAEDADERDRGEEAHPDAHPLPRVIGQPPALFAPRHELHHPASVSRRVHDSASLPSTVR